MISNTWVILLTLPILIIWLFLVTLRAYVHYSSKWCTNNVCMTGKTALITGGNSGIGYQMALALAGRGCRVIIADKDDCEQTKRKIIEETGNKSIVIKHFNLISLDSVRKLAREINETEDRLDVLVNNAGASGLKNSYTKDGLHIGMQVNHFGGFLLTHLLIDLLKKSAPSRIIFSSSFLSFTNTLTLKNLNHPELPPANPVSEYYVYSNTKLCNIITAKVLSKKLAGTDVAVNSFHPGVVYTPIYRKHGENYKVHPIKQAIFYDYFLHYIAKTPEEGAQTGIYLATAREVEGVSGKYFRECHVGSEPRKASDEEFCRNIFSASEDLVKLETHERLMKNQNGVHLL